MIVCAGAALIDCIVTGYSGEIADDIAISPGGEAFNEASVFAALGDNVFLSSAIGNDYAGKLLKNEASESGVHILSGNYKGRTPVSLLNVDDTGNRKSKVSKIHSLPGFIPGLPEADGSEKLESVNMCSLFRPPFYDPSVCFKFASEAKKRGAMLLADTKLPKGTDPKLRDYADTLSLLDFITPNEQEAEHYTGYSDPEKAAEIFHSFGVKTVIIKLSDKGCYISSQSGKESRAFYVPAFKVDVVDGIGAGDTFAAALIHCIIKGMTLSEAAVFASACSALCVSERGATSAIHSEQQVYEFLRNRKIIINS